MQRMFDSLLSAVSIAIDDKHCQAALSQIRGELLGSHLSVWILAYNNQLLEYKWVADMKV